MQSVKQQQILGYFIEEAKEHLDTIEHSLVDLRTTMSDPERVNELFRAAHSVKGGAAMLGFDSIQKTAHHFEDCFKHLKEHPVKIDQKLENLFFRGFDTLKELIEALQSPFGLREEDGQQAIIAAEPTFSELQKYLHSLTAESQASHSLANRPALAANATAQSNAILKAMLQLFKQRDSAKSRQQLIALCNRLLQLSRTTRSWVMLVQMAQKAIAAPRNAYPTLAPIIIRELKQASDLLVANRADQISASSRLQQLVNTAEITQTPPPQAVTQIPARQITATRQQASIPLEPKAAARTLLEVFNKAELIEIAEFIMKAIQ